VLRADAFSLSHNPTRVADIGSGLDTLGNGVPSDAPAVPGAARPFGWAGSRAPTVYRIASPRRGRRAHRRREPGLVQVVAPNGDGGA
jgi:hypothetical protein